MPPKKVLNYYFLNKYLHPNIPKGFRENIVVLAISQAEDETQGKYLLIQERNKHWNFPKKGVDSKNLIDGIINAFVQNIGGEMGFRGPISNEIKPRFEQKAYLINFAKQIYDKKRAEYEKNRDRPARGKVYHLVIVNYYGPSKLPVKKDLANAFIKDYKWVSLDEGLDVVNSNMSLFKTDPDSYSPDSIKFNIKLFKKCMRANNLIGKCFEEGSNQQVKMFT